MNFLLRSLAIVLCFSYSCFAQIVADLVITNANVRTMSESGVTAEAVAILGNKIIAVGTNREIAEFTGPGTRTIDAGGRLVLPGFNDSHVHFTAIGNIFSSVDLSGVRTPAEFAARVERFARFLPQGRWILGRGWNPDIWSSKVLPGRSIIDSVTPNNPFLVYSSDGKAALTNSLALSKGRIGKLSRIPSDNDIERDVSGEPTGVLLGPAIDRVTAMIPQSHVQQWPDLIETASNYAASLGVTSVQDVQSDELWDTYRDLAARGRLKTRVYDCAPLPSWSKLAAAGIRAASGDAMVRNGCLKSFSDGDQIGVNEMLRDVTAADKAGLQVMIHAIGPCANAIVLDVFERVAAANGPRDRRFRVEHAQNARKADLPRFARSQIIASMQPWLFYRPGRQDSDLRTLLNYGTRLTFGSDASMTDLDPLLGIYAAVTGAGSITVEQAVRAYTSAAAYAEFQEKVKGTLEPGKLADIVILSDDIFKIAPAKIRDTRVLFTIVDGKVVYEGR